MTWHGWIIPRQTLQVWPELCSQVHEDCPQEPKVADEQQCLSWAKKILSTSVNSLHTAPLATSNAIVKSIVYSAPFHAYFVSTPLTANTLICLSLMNTLTLLSVYQYHHWRSPMTRNVRMPATRLVRSTTLFHGAQHVKVHTQCCCVYATFVHEAPGVFSLSRLVVDPLHHWAL